MVPLFTVERQNSRRKLTFFDSRSCVLKKNKIGGKTVGRSVVNNTWFSVDPLRARTAAPLRNRPGAARRPPAPPRPRRRSLPRGLLLAVPPRVPVPVRPPGRVLRRRAVPDRLSPARTLDRRRVRRVGAAPPPRGRIGGRPDGGPRALPGGAARRGRRGVRAPGGAGSAPAVAGGDGGIPWRRRRGGRRRRGLG